MNSFVTIVVGLAFTLVVCLYAAHTLLGPWLRFRRDSANSAEHNGGKRSSRPQSAAPFHTA